MAPTNATKRVFFYLLVLVILGVLALASIPLVTSNTRDARSAMREQGLRYAPPGSDPLPPPAETFFKNYGINPHIDVEDDRLSTFGLDVDTASYDLVRTWLRQGHAIDKDMVRVEEFVNSFHYDYDPPREDEFAIHSDGAPCPFSSDLNNAYLVRLGIKGRTESNAHQPLVITVVMDESGSMAGQRIEVARQFLFRLVSELRPGDQLAIVGYSNSSRIVTNHLDASHRHSLRKLIRGLRARESTNLHGGLLEGYRLASNAYRSDAHNRVILLSDGVGNVGSTDADEILADVKRRRDGGIFLTTIGVGLDNYNDVMLEQLANKGLGRYHFLDTERDIEKFFHRPVHEALQVLARDARVQIEFNPQVVKSFRLLGYENRDIADEEFQTMDDSGAVLSPGEEVTALYELKLVENAAGPICFTRLMYTDARGADVRTVDHEMMTADLYPSWESAPRGLRLAGCAAEFAEILRESYWARGSTLSGLLDEVRAIDSQYQDAQLDELERAIDEARRQR